MGVANKIILLRCVITWSHVHWLPSVLCTVLCVLSISYIVKLWRRTCDGRVRRRRGRNVTWQALNTHTHTHTHTHTLDVKLQSAHTCPAAGRTARHGTAALWAHHQLLWQQAAQSRRISSAVSAVTLWPCLQPWGAPKSGLRHYATGYNRGTNAEFRKESPSVCGLLQQQDASSFLFTLTSMIGRASTLGKGKTMDDTLYVPYYNTVWALTWAQSQSFRSLSTP